MGARVASTKALSLQQEADTAFGRVSVGGSLASVYPLVAAASVYQLVAAGGKRVQRPPCRNFNPPD
jgi:hypothetical protein